MQEEWLKTTELEKILNISARTLRNYVKQKKVIGRKVCNNYKIFVPSFPAEMREKIERYCDEHHIYHTFTENLKYSEEDKKLALSKYDLIMKWRNFAFKYKGRKADSIKDFLKIYNTNKSANRIVYKDLKNISVSTIYRWSKRLKDFKDDWRALLPKYHNKGYKRSFLSENEKEVFLKLLLHPNRTNIGKAIKLTKHILTEQGNTNLACDMTYRRFAKKYMEEHYDLWVFSREGSKALRDRVIPYIKRDVSCLNVGDVIVGDGHRLAFQVINPFDGKPCRPTLVAYQDWKSSALIGFEIMIEENTQCIASAFRNAVINLGKLPKYVYQDNGKAFKSKYFTDSGNCIEGLFTRLGVTPIYALPYNAKAKVIERFFREMQDSFERLLPSFVGSCINDKPAYTKRNEKFHKEIHNKYIPTIDEVISLVKKWLCFHYSQPCPNVEGKTIGEVFEKGQGSGVDISELDDLMMVSEIKNIGRNGIRFLKSDYYDECLYGLRTKVVIKYSLFDLSQIKVYTPKGKFLCIAKRLEPINPLVNYTGTAKDIEDYKQRIKQQKRLEQKTAKTYIKELKKEKAYLPALQDDYNENGYFNEDKYIEAFKYAEEIEDETPVFHNKYERYDHLKKKAHPTVEEKDWMTKYEKTEEFSLIYGMTED